jgi:hypothetical protein
MELGLAGVAFEDVLVNRFEFFIQLVGHVLLLECRGVVAPED